MSLSFQISGDNTALLKALREAEQAVSKTSQQIEQGGASIDEFFARASSAMTLLGGMFAVGGISDFVRQVANVRGEFQQLEIAFTTMLQDRERAERLMAEITETAAKTPFDLQGVAQGAKQLLAYGTAAEEVNDTLRRLGDIASGVSAPLGDIVYLYGTTMTQGRMFTQDLRQFQGRGIPLAEELAKQFGVAKSEVASLVSAGKVGAEEFKQAIESMAQSRFKNLMEEQSKSITGQISNLQDQLSEMFNDIGKESEGLISGSLQGVSFLIEHYQAIGETLAVLTALYGGYRTALIAQVAVQKASAVASGVEASALGVKTVALNIAKAAQDRLNASVLANPYVLAATALVGLSYVLYKFATSATTAEEAQRSFNETLQKQAERSREAEDKARSLLTTIRDGNETQYARNKAYDDLLRLYPSLIGQIDIEILKTMELSEAIKTLNEARDHKTLEDKEAHIKQIDTALSAFAQDQHNGIYKKGNLREEQRAALETLDDRTFGSFFESDAAFVARLKKQKELHAKDLRETKHQQDFDNKSTQEKRQYYQGLARTEERLIKDLERRQEQATKLHNSQEAQRLQTEIAQKRERLEKYRSQEQALLSAHTNETKRNYDKVSEELRDARGRWHKLSREEQQGGEGQALRDEIERLTREAESLSYKSSKATTAGNKSSSEQEAKRLRQEAEARERQAQALERQLIDLSFEAEALRIDNMTDGIAAARERLEIEHLRTLETLERQRQDLLQNKDSDPVQVELLYQKGKALSEQKYDRGQAELLEREAQAMREYLREYGSFEERRQAIRDKAKADLSQATTEGERKRILADEARDLDELSEAYGRLTKTTTRLFADLSTQGRQQLVALRAEAQALLAYLSAGQWQEVGTSGRDAHGLTLEAFQRLRDSPKELESIRKQTEEIDEAARRAGGAFMQVSEGIRAMFEAGDNPAALQKAIASIREGLGQISEGLGFVRDTFQTLADATGSDALQGLSEGIGIATEALGKAQQGMQAGATIGGLFGPAGAALGSAIGGVVGGVTSLIGSFAKMKDAKHERTIQAIGRQIEGLDKSYQRLGKSIERAYSSDASKLIAQQERLLRQKQTMLRQQMAEERQKKKSDPDKLRRYQSEIEQIGETIADNKRRAEDAIFGSDVKSAINDFATAYASAWEQGNDRAEASKDFVKKQIRAMILEMIKAKSNPAIEALRKKLREFWSDERLSESEAKIVEQMGVNLQQQMDAMLGEHRRYLEDETTGSISGSKRGFEAMNQDTATELNGRFTAIQQDVRLIAESFAEVRTLHIESLGHLEGISRNTHKLHEVAERLEAIERHTRQLR